MEDPREAGEGSWFKTGWRLIRDPSLRQSFGQLKTRCKKQIREKPPANVKLAYMPGAD
jgi:hypothetical protein